jgi:hypothetical protein
VGLFSPLADGIATDRAPAGGKAAQLDEELISNTVDGHELIAGQVPVQRVREVQSKRPIRAALHALGCDGMSGSPPGTHKFLLPARELVYAQFFKPTDGYAARVLPIRAIARITLDVIIPIPIGGEDSGKI